MEEIEALKFGVPDVWSYKAQGGAAPPPDRLPSLADARERESGERGWGAAARIGRVGVA